MKPGGRRSRARGPALLTVGVLGALALASLVSRQFLEGPSDDPAPRRPERPGFGQQAARDAESSYRVAAIEGEVEALHDGKWYVVRAGDQLALQDVLRTPRDATALLRRGASEVEVRQGVDIRLDALASQTASFDVLRGGRVIASVENPDETVVITAAETRAVNKGVARFVVNRDPRGGVSVAAASGQVLFAARGKQVRLERGQESTAPAGGAPSDPEPIPEALLLSVVWPERDRSQARAQVTGKVRPSSLVQVNGVEAPVLPDGRFASSIPLSVGNNRVEVSAEDIVGRKKAVSRVVRRTPPAPLLEPAGEEIWKK